MFRDTDFVPWGVLIARTEAYLPTVLAAIPKETDIPKSFPKTEPKVFVPNSFAELVTAKGDLQAVRKVFTRTPKMREKFAEWKARLDQERAASENGLSLLEQSLLRRLRQQSVIFEHNFAPYEISRDISHFVMWYATGTSRETRALQLAYALVEDELEPTDAVVISHPYSRRSVPGADHTQVFFNYRKPYSRFAPIGLEEIYGFRLTVS